MSWTEQHWRAYVERDWTRQGVAIYVGRSRDGQIREAAKPTAIEFAEVPEAVAIDPWLRLPDDVGRTLLDALTAHYGGTSDLRQLRRDYDAERARVDRLIDQLTIPRPLVPGSGS